MIFYDLDYMKTPIVQAITISLFLIYTLFLFLAVQVVVLNFVQYRFRILKVRRHYFDWLNPKSEPEQLFCYKLLSVTNFLIIG